MQHEHCQAKLPISDILMQSSCPIQRPLQRCPGLPTRLHLRQRACLSIKLSPALGPCLLVFVVGVAACPHYPTLRALGLLLQAIATTVATTLSVSPKCSHKCLRILKLLQACYAGGNLRCALKMHAASRCKAAVTATLRCCDAANLYKTAPWDRHLDSSMHQQHPKCSA